MNDECAEIEFIAQRSSFLLSFLRVAQMESRASDYESEGREFKSLHGGQFVAG